MGLSDKDFESTKIFAISHKEAIHEAKLLRAVSSPILRDVAKLELGYEGRPCAILLIVSPLSEDHIEMQKYRNIFLG